MKLVYLPANMCWAVILGDSIVSVDLRDSGPSVRFWESRAQAVKALAAIGLKASRSGALSAVGGIGTAYTVNYAGRVPREGR